MGDEPGAAPPSGAGDEARVVLCTAPDERTALELARKLVQARLAACVNLLPGATSVYRWQGALEEAQEVLLVIKTRAGRAAALARLLATEHPYEVPEIVALAPREVEARYLAWLLSETDGG